MRVLVVSDIHSNLAALDAVLDGAGEVDAVWVLGDIVGYGAQPNEVVERLIALGAVGVRGNHDDAICGGDSIESFSPDGYAAAIWARRQITPATRRYLDALPEVLAPGGTDFTLVHGSPREPIWEYIDATWIASENLTAFETRYCLVGHTHVPRVYRQRRGHMESVAVDAEARLSLGDDRLIINPGSVGQPRDGDPRASFMLIDVDTGVVTWRRVAYDVETAQQTITAAGLPPRLASRLSGGR